MKKKEEKGGAEKEALQLHLERGSSPSLGKREEKGAVGKIFQFYGQRGGGDTYWKEKRKESMETSYQKRSAFIWRRKEKGRGLEGKKSAFSIEGEEVFFSIEKGRGEKKKRPFLLPSRRKGGGNPPPTIGDKEKSFHIRLE